MNSTGRPMTLLASCLLLCLLVLANSARQVEARDELAHRSRRSPSSGQDEYAAEEQSDEDEAESPASPDQDGDSSKGADRISVVAIVAKIKKCIKDLKRGDEGLNSVFTESCCKLFNYKGGPCNYDSLSDDLEESSTSKSAQRRLRMAARNISESISVDRVVKCVRIYERSGLKAFQRSCCKMPVFAQVTECRNAQGGPFRPKPSRRPRPRPRPTPTAIIGVPKPPAGASNKSLRFTATYEDDEAPPPSLFVSAPADGAALESKPPTVLPENVPSEVKDCIYRVIIARNQSEAARIFKQCCRFKELENMPVCKMSTYDLETQMEEMAETRLSLGKIIECLTDLANGILSGKIEFPGSCCVLDPLGLLPACRKPSLFSQQWRPPRPKPSLRPRPSRRPKPSRRPAKPSRRPSSKRPVSTTTESPDDEETDKPAAKSTAAPSAEPQESSSTTRRAAT